MPVVLSLFALAGCTFLQSPAAEEAARIRAAASERERVARLAEYDLSTIDISDTDLECEPAADWAMDWVTTHYTQSINFNEAPLPEDYFAMVEVGAGDKPGQTWWILAVISHDDWAGRDDDGNLLRHDMSFLTDSDQWIDVGSFHATRPDSADWSTMRSWSDERILRGLQAQKRALSCLPASVS